MKDVEQATEAIRHHEVVIVGGGPTGMVLAAELALAKVDVAIVERRPSPALAGSRAGGLHARTIEVLDQRGVAQRFLSQGKKVQVASFGGTMLDISDFPTRHGYGLALFQNHIERILSEWVAELPVVTYRGHVVSDFTEDETGVTVGLEGGPDLRGKYLVGCDGGRSTIRKRAGIEFPGWDPSVSYLIAEIEVSEELPPGLRRDEKGVYGIGKLDDGRARAVLREDEIGRGDDPSLDEVRQLLIRLYGKDFGVKNPTWISRFSDMTRQAASYRKGRVLLAGDAAHVHAPNGGQGLNIGVQDAVNLGWKLAQVVRGTSPDSLLDTYHAERHPVGARVLESTKAQTALSRGDARMDAVRDSIAELLQMTEPRKRYGGMLSGLDVHYDLGPGHPLVGRRMPDLDIVVGDATLRVYSLLHDARPVLLVFAATTAIDASRWAERVRRVDATYDGEWLLPVMGRVEAPQAVLIRPDGHVAWVGEGSERGLFEALERWFGPPT